MKNIATLLLLATILILLVVTTALVLDLDKERAKNRVIERRIETIEVPSDFVYYSDLELNEEVQKIVEGGGTQDLLDFFDGFTNNTHVSAAILQESLNQKVPLCLAFSLAWGESRFRTRLRNANGGHTTDWGLFQLNDGHREDWTEEEFYDIEKNTKEGLNYLAYSLYTFGNDTTLAIAGYNKGVGNVVNGAPITKITLVHINNIIEYEHTLEIRLNMFVNSWEK